MTARWGVPDPVAVQGTPEEIALAFRDAFTVLDRWTGLLLSQIITESAPRGPITVAHNASDFFRAPRLPCVSHLPRRSAILESRRRFCPSAAPHSSSF